MLATAAPDRHNILRGSTLVEKPFVFLSTGRLRSKKQPMGPLEAQTEQSFK